MERMEEINHEIGLTALLQHGIGEHDSHPDVSEKEKPVIDGEHHEVAQ